MSLGSRRDFLRSALAAAGASAIAGARELKKIEQGPRGRHAIVPVAAASKTLQPNALVYLPAKYDSSRRKKWPLLVWLHGASGRGSNLDIVKRYGPPRVAEATGDFPFVVVSPQCTPGQLWSDAAAIVALTDQIERSFRIDRKKIYLTGLSMGGGGAWFVASKFPDRYAAVAPMCGPTQPKDWAPGLRNVKIWCFHGEKDELIPVDRSRDMVDAIRRLGGKPKLTILKGQPHDITREYEDDRLYKWMLKQKRKRV